MVGDYPEIGGQEADPRVILAGNQPEPARQASPFELARARYEQAASTLDDTISRLEARIAPVLRTGLAAVDPEDTAKTVEATAASEVVELVDSANRVLHFQARRIEKLLERLDI